MLIAYVDESYRDDLYLMAAAVAEQASWEDFDDALNALRGSVASSYGLSSSIEFHGHEIMGGKHEWAPLRGRHREVSNIYQTALQLGVEARVTYMFRGVDVRRLNARYSYPRPPHIVTMDHILERLDDFALRNSREQLIVVADQHSMQEKLNALFQLHQIVGTDGYRPSKLRHISSPLNFARSCDTPGLELVDLALYLRQRCRSVPVEPHPVAERSRKRLVRLVEPLTTIDSVWRP